MKVYKHPHKVGWLRVIGNKINGGFIQLDIARSDLSGNTGQARQQLKDMMTERELTIQPPAVELDPEFGEIL